MPGDINTYSLGIEFKFNAAPTMKALDEIAAKAVSIQSAMAKGITISPTGIDKAAEAQTQFNNANQDIIKSLTGINKWMTNLADTIEANSDKRIEYNTILKRTHDIQREMEKNYAKLSTYEEKVPELYEKVGKSIEKVKNLQADMEEQLRREDKDWKEYGDAVDEAFDKAADKSNNIIKIFSKITHTSPETIKGIIKFTDKLGILPKSLKPITMGVDKMGEASKKGFKKMMLSSRETGMSLDIFKSTMGLTAKGAGSAGQMIGAGGKAMSLLGSAADVAGPVLLAVGAAIAVAAAAIAVLSKVSNIAGQAFEKLTGSSTTMTKAISDGLKSFSLWKAATTLVSGIIDELIMAQEAFVKATYRAGGSIHEVVEFSQELREELKLTNEESIKLTDAILTSGMAFVASNKKVVELSKSVGKFTLTTGVSEKTAAGLARVLIAITGRTDSAKKVFDVFTGTMKKLGMTAQEADSILSNLKDTATELTALFGSNATEQYAEAMAGLTAQFTKFGGGASEAKEILDGLTKTTTVAGMMSWSFAGKVKSVENTLKGQFIAVQRVASSWDMMSRPMKERLAPALGMTTRGIDLLNKTLKESGGNVDTAVAKMKKLVDAGKDTAKGWEDLRSIRQQLIRAFEPVAAALVKWITPLVKFLTGDDMKKGWIETTLVPWLEKAKDKVIGLLDKLVKLNWAEIFNTVCKIFQVASDMIPVFSWIAIKWEEIKFVIGWIAKNWDNICNGASKLQGLIDGIGEKIGVVGKFIVRWFVSPMRAVLYAIKEIKKLFESDFIKTAAKSIVNFGSKIPLIGRLFRGVKKDATGSGFLGIDKLIKDVMPYIDKFNRPWGGISKSVGGLKNSFDVMSVSAKNATEMVNSLDKTTTITPKNEIAKESAIGNTNEAITGVMSANARPVATVMREEMGRKSESNVKINVLVERMDQLVGQVGTIIDVIKSSDDPGKILDTLQKYLPRMAEGQSDLSCSASMW